MKSLALPAEKHTQANAEKVSGKSNRLFSNFLSGKISESKNILNRHSRKRIAKLLRTRTKIENGASWTVPIILDATLHIRASKKLENAQVFNHGKGWLWGINGLIPIT